MQNTIYLLTDAAGNLGSNIGRVLVKQNKKVRGLVQPDSPLNLRLPREVQQITGDILEQASLDGLFSVPQETDTIVIHCANRVSQFYDQKTYGVNVTGTKNIIAKCLEYKVKKLVYISSIKAIPKPPKGQAVCEADSFSPLKAAGFYGKTKAQASQLVLDAVSRQDLDASLIIPVETCGPYDYDYGYISNFIINYAEGKFPIGLKCGFSAVDIRDLVNSVIACAEKGRKGESYIISNDNITMRRLFELVSKHTGAKDVKLIFPLWLGRFLIMFCNFPKDYGNKADALSQFSLFRKVIAGNEYSYEKAYQELGFKPRSYEDTIRDSVSWLKDENKLIPHWLSTENPCLWESKERI